MRSSGLVSCVLRARLFCRLLGCLLRGLSGVALGALRRCCSVFIVGNGVRGIEKKAREALPEVTEAEGSHTAGTAVVTLSAPVDDAALKAAVEAKDYTVTGIA